MRANPKSSYDSLLGVVLCGGRASRMGGQDKGLLMFKGEPLVRYGIDALAPCQAVIVNANRHRQQYQKIARVEVIADASHDFGGPLCGLLSASEYALSQGLSWVISVPCDAPFISKDFVHAMYRAHQRSNSLVYVAKSTRLEPIFALFSVKLGDDIRAFLAAGHRKVMNFYETIGYQAVVFDEAHCFTNINTKAALSGLAMPRTI